MLDYDKIKKDLFLCNPHSSIEFEIKFGEYQKSFSSINYTQMKRLKANFDLSDKRLVTYYMNDHSRKIITTFKTHEEVKLENYKTINYIYDYNYNLHMYITQSNPISSVNHTMMIEKTEYHFIIYLKNTYHLILSEIVKDITTYEVSIKLKINLLDDSWMSEIDQLINNVILILNGTTILYTQTQQKQLINDCENCFKSKLSTILNNPVPIQLENLKFDEPYIISTKSKGIRTMLIIHYTGMWLVDANHYHLLTNESKDLSQAWHLTVFDGDLIKPINYNQYDFNYQYWYLAFDCLCFNKIDLRNQHYINRIDMAKTFNSLVPWYLDDSFFKFSLKTTRVAQYTDEIILQVQYILGLQELINYDHNGLIFTPANRGYNDVIYKYTYPSKTTIDFAIYNGQESVNLYVYDDKTLKDVPFNGTQLAPFDETMLFQEPFQKNKKYIAECKWNKIMDKMVLVKIRDDKERADSVELVLENWKNINNNPIDNDNC